MVGKTFIAAAVGVAAVNAQCTFPYGTQLAGNSIFTPDGSNTPTIGVPFSVTYDGTGLNTNLRFILLRGPGNNLVELGPIADVTNCGSSRCSFSWTPAANLEPDTSRYGLRLLDLTTCSYQYTTQFGLNAGTAPRPSSSSSAAASASASASVRPSGSILSPRPSGSASVPPPAPSGSAPVRPSSAAVPSGGPVPSGSRPPPPPAGGDDDCEDEPYKPAPSGSAKPAPGSYAPPAPSGAGKPAPGPYTPPASGYYPNNGTGSSNGTGGVSPSYRPLQSNDGARMAISAFGAVVAVAAAIMVL